MNKRGQALVEFIIILPIFLILVLGVVDIGKILYNQTMLEGVMNDVISMYEDGIATEQILEDLDLRNSELTVLEENQLLEFRLVKEIDIVTPGLNLIFDNPYELLVSRSISYE